MIFLLNIIILQLFLPPYLKKRVVNNDSSLGKSIQLPTPPPVYCCQYSDIHNLK